MNEIVCPQCATVNRHDELTPHADNFCSKCDFPLFWDQMYVASVPTDEATDAALRRLPGVAGRDTRAMRPCPECSEPNVVANENCSRCGAVMEPPPPPPPPPEPEPIIVPPRVPPGPDYVLFALMIAMTVFAVGLLLYGFLG